MRLKPGAKVFLTIVVLVLVVAGVWRLGWLDPLIKVVAPDRAPEGEITPDMFPKSLNGANETTPTGNTGQASENNGQAAGGGKLGRPLRVGIVMYGGMAGGLIANNGTKPNPASVFSSEYGVEVEFVQIDDLIEMADAFRVGGDNGGLDLMATTADMFVLQYQALAAIKPVTVLQTDWSRGADAIAVGKGIKSVTGLKGKKVAVAEATPSQFLLLYVLTQAGMSNKDIKPVYTTSAIEAADIFSAGKADACVSWSPFVYFAAEGVPGASILASTVDVTNLLAGTVVCRGDVAQNYPESVAGFVAGWMKGVDMANADPEVAAQVLLKSYQGITLDDANGMLMDVKLADLQANRNFFELDGDAVMGYDDLWTTATRIWQTIGKLEQPTRPDLSRKTMFLGEIAPPPVELQVPETKEFEFAEPTKEVQKQEPVVTKRISIYFETGKYELDENAKAVLEQAAELAQTFGSAYLRVSGNTDSVGGREMNLELSRKRAQSVVDYVVAKYGFPRDKFIVVGNGPDKPVAGNDTPEGRKQNRRTDFEVIPQE